MRTAIEHYLADVRDGSFPDDEKESFHAASADELRALYGEGVVIEMPKAK